MLDTILKNALTGVTVIEEETGSVSRILAKQLAGYAKEAGKSVVFLSYGVEERPALARNLEESDPPSEVDRSLEADNGWASSVYATTKRYSFLEGLEYDLIVIDSFSTYLYNKTEKDAQEMIKQVARISRQYKRSFIITYDKALLSERMAAFLRAIADSVIIVKVEITVDRITRALYVPKMRDSKPMDRLIKFTIDEGGVEVDTREFVG